MNQPNDVLQALDELERALEAFRAAYHAWLDGDRDGDGEVASALRRALHEAEQRLDAARSLLAAATEGQSYP